MTTICQKCTLKIKDNQLRLNCRDCSRWFHASCCDVSAVDLQYLRDENLTWKCADCLALDKSNRDLAPIRSSPLGAGNMAGLPLTTQHFDEIMAAMASLKRDNQLLSTGFAQLKQGLDLCNDNLSRSQRTFQDTLDEFKSEIRALRMANEQLENRVRSLETQLGGRTFDLDQAVLEFSKRQSKQRNIMIFGLKECSELDNSAEVDRGAVCEILSICDGDVATGDLRIERLGRGAVGRDRKPRPVRAVLPSVDHVSRVLKNTGRLKSREMFKSVYVTPDRTPHQVELFRAARAELRRRTDSGESGLRIKNIGGVPSVVTSERVSRNRNLN